MRDDDLDFSNHVRWFLGLLNTNRSSWTPVEWWSEAILSGAWDKIDHTNNNLVRDLYILGQEVLDEG